MGQALPASNISPPTQTMMGGSGGGGSLSIVQATADGASGVVPVKAITLKANVAASPNFEQATGDPTNVNYFKL